MGKRYYHNNGQPKKSQQKNRIKFPEGASGVASGRSALNALPECNICLERKPIKCQGCCKYMACGACVKKYNDYQRVRGLTPTCPQCRKPRRARAPLSRQERHLQTMINLQIARNPYRKRCPRCFEEYVREVNRGILGFIASSINTKVVCEYCDLEWCFDCHVPYHEGVSCQQHSRGDDNFQRWAEGHTGGERNATACPSCGIWIQRSGGCNNMTCPQCSTHFCYLCGRKPNIDLLFWGHHYTWWSLVGCDDKWFPRNPTKRLLGRLAIAVFILILVLLCLYLFYLSMTFIVPRCFRLYRYLRCGPSHSVLPSPHFGPHLQTTVLRQQFEDSVMLGCLGGW